MYLVRGETQTLMKNKKNNGNRFTEPRFFFLSPVKSIEINKLYTNLYYITEHRIVHGESLSRRRGPNRTAHG